MNPLTATGRSNLPRTGPSGHGAALWIAIGLCLPWTQPPVLAAGPLQRRCQAMVTASDLGDTTVSLFAVDLEQEAVLVALRPDHRMIPASNMKLITTVAALALLGPSFEFTTELRLVRGATEPDSGDTIVIAGDGDPALGHPLWLAEQQDIDVEQMLDGWVERILQAGVQKVVRLVVDDRIFDRQWTHPQWPADQLNRWYAAEVGGLNIHENCLYVYPRPTEVGHSPTIVHQPYAPFISRRARNRAVTDRHDTFWVSRRHNTNDLTYFGNVGLRRTRPVKVTVHNPPLFLGRLVAGRLEAAGVPVASVEAADDQEQLARGRTLVRHVTPLTEVVRLCNKSSLNLFAEALLKRMGNKVTGAQGSWATGAAAVRTFLRDELGPAAALCQVSDGSGLSRRNRVTARLLVDLLAAAYHRDTIGPIFTNSLAIGGVDGTLRKRLADLNGTVYGKSGYINGVSALSGYLIVPDSPPPQDRGAFDPDRRQQVVAFSFLFNNIGPPVYLHEIKACQERLVGLIDEHYAQAVEPAAGSDAAN